MRSAVTGLLVALVVCAPAPAAAGDQFTLVVTGAPGGAAFEETLTTWRQSLVATLRAQDGHRDDHLIVLAATPGPGVGQASREGVVQAFAGLKTRLGADSLPTIVLLGHGTDDGGEAKFNRVGPDLSARAWDDLVAALPGRVVFVNTAAASFPYVERLAGDGRVVIAATSTPLQRYDTVFPEFFVAALGSDAADSDRDGRVSVWEAFVLASADVRRFYQRQGQLATERAVLDDTGDGLARDADAEGLDGLLAARVFVGAGVSASGGRVDPVLAPVTARRDALEAAVAELRGRRDAMDAVAYRAELERLLTELARVSREVRRRTRGS